MTRRGINGSAAIAVLVAVTGHVIAGEAEIVARIEAFFRTNDPDVRETLASRIENDAAYDRRRMVEWLHAADLFEPLEAGPLRLEIPIDHGQTRETSVRVPADYRPSRPWPLIYALHGGGDSHSGIVRYVEQLLGDRVDEFIIAAPNNYEQIAMGEDGPPSVEHRAILLALKKELHIDCDRVYVTGYSRGGYAAWTLATLHADEFAGVIPIACTYSVLPYVEGLWETMLPNLRHVPVLHCWGEQDFLPTLNLGGQALDATITEQNSGRLVPLTRRLGMNNIVHHQNPGVGHAGVVPPAKALHDVLGSVRVGFPDAVQHRFRYIHQAGACWLEGLRWRGASWSHQRLEVRPRPGETFEQMLGRAIHQRLGELTGSIEGQTIRVSQRHVADVVIWLGDGMIDWAEPIRVLHDGSTVYEGRVAPDIGVCLAQAARTYDFHRLRWSGLRLSGSGRARSVTGRTRFPALMEGE